jgi:hypothetical protein
MDEDRYVVCAGAEQALGIRAERSEHIPARAENLAVYADVGYRVDHIELDEDAFCFKEAYGNFDVALDEPILPAYPLEAELVSIVVRVGRFARGDEGG